VVETYGILALRDGRKWSEMGLSSDRPLDVVEAVRKVNAIQLPSNRPPRIKPRLPVDRISGNIVLRIDHAAVGYPGHKLFIARDLELRRGECAALIGPNGSGKTTFLKLLLDQLKPLQGEVRLGASLKIGYFAQAHDALSGDHSVLDELLRHKAMDPGPARSYLAQYLFRDEDVFKPLNALSGGERARLAFAILALQSPNFLLLDEPTNHLDIPAREALQEVLENYPGTVLLVSHDRYLIDRLATQIWELHEGRLEVFNGSYREYILRGSVRRSSKKAPSSMQKLLMQSRPMARDNSKETRRREQSLNLVEERIREQELAVQRLSNDLQKAGKTQSYDRIHHLSSQLAKAQATLDDLMAEWERLAA
jgi:ATP-binding cassette subfamily F protein 3